MNGNNLSRGVDIPAQSGRALARAMLLMLLLSLLLGAAITVWSADRQINPAAWPWLEATAKAASFNVLDWQGRTISLPNGTKVNSLAWLQHIYPGLLLQLQPVAIKAAWRGVAWGSAAFIALLILSWWRGRQLGIARVIRGGRFSSAMKLRWMLHIRRKASDISIGEIPMVKSSETLHTLIVGAPGTGKSVLFNQLLDQVQKRGERCFIFDKKQDFVATHFCAARGDVVLNPLDDRFPGRWDPWGEVRHVADYDRLAASIIPAGTGDSKYWHEAARSLLSAAMLRLADNPQRSVKTLLDLVLSGSLQELAELVKGTDASVLLSPENEKMALSVRSTLNTYVRSLRLLPDRPDAEAFSIRDWVSNDDGRGCIFLTSSGSQHESLKPLISCLCDCLVASILSLSTDRNRRIHMFLDELPSLQALPSLPAGISESRAFGLSIYAGIQGVPQLRDAFGRDRAESLTSSFGTHVYLRVADPDSAEWASKSLCEEDLEEHNESISYGGGEIRDGINNATQRHTRRLVTASEVMRLKDLEAFVKLPGSWPISRTRLRIIDRPIIAKPHIAAPNPQQRPDPHQVLSSDHGNETAGHERL